MTKKRRRAGRPRLPASEQLSVPFMVRLDPDRGEMLRELAAHQGVSVSYLLRRWFAEGIAGEIDTTSALETTDPLSVRVTANLSPAMYERLLDAAAGPPPRSRLARARATELARKWVEARVDAARAVTEKRSQDT